MSQRWMNPFATQAELEAMQAYAERERWRLECQALGAKREDIEAYEQRAYDYACTTVFPNSMVVELARRAARDSLLRGDGLPTDVEAAIQSEFARDLARSLKLD